jgi:hypothetical protein
MNAPGGTEPRRTVDIRYRRGPARFHVITAPDEHPDRRPGHRYKTH